MSQNIENIYDFVKERANRLGLNSHSIRRENITLEANELRHVKAHNTWYFLTQDLDDLSIESRHGAYSRINHLVKSNTIEHKGNIELKNHS